VSEATFERLAREGRAAILAGTNQIETPPVDGGQRWGLSIVLRPDGDVVDALDAATATARSIAGTAQWATAAKGSAHITVRGLEPHRVPLPDHDPVVDRYTAALDRATRDAVAARFVLGGLLVTPNSVMLRAAPCDDGPERLSRSLERELGDDAWYESAFHRDIWFLNLIHFAGPVERPDELNAWVEQQSRSTMGECTVTHADLVRWQFGGTRMVPIVLAAMPLTGAA
jgi:hypothetical protein